MKKVTKIIGLILALAISVSMLTACGGDNGDVAKCSVTAEQYQTFTPEQIIEKCIKDRTAITPEEYIDLLSTFQYAEVNEEALFVDMECPTYEAIDILRDDESAVIPEQSTFINNILAHENRAVRSYGVSLLQSWLGVIDEDIEPVKELLKNETDPLVQRVAVDGLASYIEEDADVLDFYLRMVKSDNAEVKTRLAVALGRDSLKDVAGVLDAMIALTKDEDADVKDVALEEIGSLRNDGAIPVLEAVLTDNSQAEFHGSAAEGLAAMWHGFFPDYEYTNEQAYNVAMNYIKNCPIDEKTPDWIAVRSFYFQDKEGFEDFKTRAAYFNSAEVAEAMKRFIQSPDTEFLVMDAAIDVLKCVCTKAELEANKPLIDALEGTQYDTMKKEYEEAIAQ